MVEERRQLIDQVRMPVSAQPVAVIKENVEHVRQGMYVIWMFVEPLAGWRAAPVPFRKPAIWWTQQMREGSRHRTKRKRTDHAGMRQPECSPAGTAV